MMHGQKNIKTCVKSVWWQ